MGNFKDTIGFALMGLGGGLSRQDFVGNYLDYEKEQEKDYQQEYYRSLVDPNYQPGNIEPGAAEGGVRPESMEGGGSPYVEQAGQGMPPQGLGGMSVGGGVTPQDFLQGGAGSINQELQGGRQAALGGGQNPFAFPEQRLDPRFGTKAQAFAKVTPQDEAQKTVWETREKKWAEFQEKVAESKVASQHNFELVSQNMYDLSTLLAGALDEGGAGNKWKSFKAGLAREGWMPEDKAKNYRQSSAVYGKRIEIIAKMFPMLTQQIGKEGSIRLIESIFSRIGQTIPDLHNAPEISIDEMGATIESMYRVQRALEQLDLTDFDFSDPTQQKAFEDRVISAKDALEIKGTEKRLLDEMKKGATQPIQNWIEKRDSKKSGKASQGYKDKYGLR